MQSNTYLPLCDSPKAMRLVRLAPSANFGHISVTAQLIETSWDECNYEALSYCWGKNQKKKRILLNGEQFEITADLYNALEHLCLEHESRQLWVGFLYGWANGSLTLSSQIDAICINQTDTDEKSLQVQRMRDIYQNAERVLIWTGPSTTNTQQAFEKVNQLLACNDINAREDIWNGKDDQWIHCLNEIIKRPYWSRAWTVQEVVLARTALLYCGHDTIPFFDFARFLTQETTRDKVKVKYALFSYLKIVSGMRKPSYQDPPTGLFGLAYQLRYRQCTVSHDRLYAFLGLLRGESLSTEELHVDYKMGLQKLSTMFSKATMMKYKTLLPLVLAERMFPSFPTWCYDWSAKTPEPNQLWHGRRLFWTGGLDDPIYYPLHSTHHSAAGGLPARLKVDFELLDIISVQGFRISNIASVGKIAYRNTARPNYVRLFKNWERMLGGPWEDPEKTAKFARTITGGAWDRAPASWRAWNTKDYSERWNPDYFRYQVIPDLTRIDTGYHMSLHQGVDIRNNEAQIKYDRIRDDACEDRRLFILENGDYGIGPSEVKIGDPVVILLGSQVPLVLHKRDYNGLRGWVYSDKAKLCGSTWKFLGQAYIDDRMKYGGDLQRDINTGQVLLEDFLMD
ncbi:heterokaryon incompatibility protein-domain-containing protein [Fusarium tricinctum]|uniref:Heterokaryon incompatibility protein-domain-containing protein n=1 Tax=Fusarium tricinctum TaxID=61284 RepID=A0A8K0RNB9_9HYPO|nr:heterokaryon incompatibility protein-domain-containing protein [Fusarium tricinctum]